MAKQSGLGDRLLVDGYNLSGDIGSLTRIGGGPAALEVTGIDKEAFERLGGKLDGVLSFSSWFNDASAQAHPVLSTLPRTDRVLTYCRGFGLGSPAASMVGKQINYDPNRAEDGQLTLGIEAQANGYGLTWGEQLTAGLRTDTTATNGTSLDGTASTDFGGLAYLQVESVTGTSVTVTLQDSADNSSFANITGAAFTAATGRGSQRIAFTGTVRRYVRAITSGTFSEAVFLVHFTRHATEVSF